MKCVQLLLWLAVVLLFSVNEVHAQNSTNPEPVYTLDTGDTAWMLTSSALVMLMTPGLAFFYGGLVRERNSLNAILMNYVSLGFISVHWVVFGYTFAFGKGNEGYGDFKWIGLKDVSISAPDPAYAPTIPHALHMVYQMMFAIITPALISGAVVERMKFSSFIIFVLAWATICYDTLAHWVWAAWIEYDADGNAVNHYGYLRQLGAIDFAGGTVVHMSSGFSALFAAAFVGKRKDVDPDHPSLPHNIPLVLLGAALLWFGWFGFNSGSALSSSGLAVLAFVNTQVATATAFVTWVTLDYIIKKQVTAVGAATSIVVGLVTITPGSGFVDMQSSIAFGIIGVLATYFSIEAKTKYWNVYLPQVDDALDVFSCHAVAGTVGTLLTGCFASKAANPAGADGLFFGGPILLGYQFAAVCMTILLSAITTSGLMITLKYTIGLSVENAEKGVDYITHGRAGYVSELDKARIFAEMVDISGANAKPDEEASSPAKPSDV